MTSSERRILVAVDGSPPSFAALDYAVPLARALDADLDVVTVLDVDQLKSFVGVYLNLEHLFEELRKETLDKAQARLPPDAPRAQLRVVEGRTLRALLHAAEEPGVEAVVLGRTGKGALERVLEGSVSRWMSAHCPVPLVVVPGEAAVAAATPVSRVLALVDGSEPSLRALAMAERIARARDARLQIAAAADLVKLERDRPALHDLRREGVVDRDDEVRHDVLDAARARVAYAAVETALLAGPPAETLLDHVEAERPSLVVLGRKGKGPVRRLLEGSVSRAFALHCPVPVMVVP